MKAVVKRITMQREGDLKEESFGSWDDADKRLTRWSMNAPEGGGYDKVFFKVEWEGVDRTYTGRFDLVSWKDKPAPSLREHVVEMAFFYTGRRHPARMDIRRYKAMLDQFNKSGNIAKQYDELLETCDLGIAEIPPRIVAIMAM